MFSLPEEILSQISTNLQPQEIIKLSLTCIYLNKLIKQDNFWLGYDIKDVYHTTIKKLLTIRQIQNMQIIHHIYFAHILYNVKIIDKNHIMIDDSYVMEISIHTLYHNKIKFFKKIPGVYITNHNSTYITIYHEKLYIMNVSENTLFTREIIVPYDIRLYNNYFTYLSKKSLMIEDLMTYKKIFTLSDTPIHDYVIVNDELIIISIINFRNLQIKKYDLIKKSIISSFNIDFNRYELLTKINILHCGIDYICMTCTLNLAIFDYYTFIYDFTRKKICYENKTYYTKSNIIIYNDCIIDMSKNEIQDYQGIIKQKIQHNIFAGVKIHDIKNNMMLLSNEKHITMYKMGF
jgi:hypothetical protein